MRPQQTGSIPSSGGEIWPMSMSWAVGQQSAPTAGTGCSNEWMKMICGGISSDKQQTIFTLSACQSDATLNKPIIKGLSSGMLAMVADLMHSYNTYNVLHIQNSKCSMKITPIV